MATSNIFSDLSEWLCRLDPFKEDEPGSLEEDKRYNFNTKRFENLSH